MAFTSSASPGDGPAKRVESPTVLCAGLSCVDHVWQVESFPPSVSRTPASAYRTQGGGPAATAAVTVARLGGRAHLWAVHGDDPGGSLAIDELRAYGVDTAGVHRWEGASSWVSAVLVAPGGERYIFPYYGSGLRDEAPQVAPPGGAGAVLVDLRHPVLCQAALEHAALLRVPAIGDVSNTRHWELTERLDVLIASEECAFDVLGRHDPEAALGALRWRPEQHVGITLGGEGYLYDAGEGVKHLPALEVEVVDTNGAGDVFHGAYAFALAAGQDVDSASWFALATSALSCTGLGRSAIPRREEVEELLERYGPHPNE